MYPLISRDRIEQLVSMHQAVDAVLLPAPEGNKKIIMKVLYKDVNGVLLEGYLAMAYKPEARTFSSPDSAWRLSRKLGLKNLMIDNDKFAGAAA